MAGAVRDHLLALLQGKDPVDHQFTGVDSKELGRAVLHGKTVIHSVYERLILLVRMGGRLRGTSGQQDRQGKKDNLFHRSGLFEKPHQKRRGSGLPIVEASLAPSSLRSKTMKSGDSGV